MLTDTAAVRTYFAKLGFEPEIADIYLALYAHGPQTISELSRTSKVERTRIYRLLDHLLESNLIEVESHYKRGIIRAAPVSNLQILISEKQQEVKSLEQELSLIEQVLSKNSLSDPTTRVQFYHGPEGIRQMQWNLLKTNTDILSIMHEPMQNGTGDAFFRRWTEQWNEQQTNRCRIVLDEYFLEASNAWHRSHPGTVPKSMDARVVDPSTFSITFGTDIYNDVVAYYNWYGKEVFGVEIYNKDIANAQRIFFETLWEKAKKPAHDLGRLQTSSLHSANTKKHPL